MSSACQLTACHNPYFQSDCYLTVLTTVTPNYIWLPLPVTWLWAQQSYVSHLLSQLLYYCHLYIMWPKSQLRSDCLHDSHIPFIWLSSHYHPPLIWMPIECKCPLQVIWLSSIANMPYINCHHNWHLYLHRLSSQMYSDCHHKCFLTII